MINWKVKAVVLFCSRTHISILIPQDNFAGTRHKVPFSFQYIENCDKSTSIYIQERCRHKCILLFFFISVLAFEMFNDGDLAVIVAVRGKTVQVQTAIFGQGRETFFL